MFYENQNQARNVEGILSPWEPKIQRVEEEQKEFKNLVVSLESHQQLRKSITIEEPNPQLRDSTKALRSHTIS